MPSCFKTIYWQLQQSKFIVIVFVYLEYKQISVVYLEYKLISSSKSNQFCRQYPVYN